MYPTQHRLFRITETDSAYSAVQKIRFILTFTAMPWLRRLVAGLSQQKPGFDHKSVDVRFMVESGNGVGIFWVVWLAMSASFHRCPTLSFIYKLLLPARSNGRRMRTFQKTVHQLSVWRVSTSYLSVSILYPCS
jgi:hypothetical protein